MPRAGAHVSQHTTIETARRPGPPLAVALPLLIGGVVAVVVGVAFFFTAFSGFSTATPFTTPSTVAETLDPATYVVYQQPAASISRNIAPLSPGQVVVSTPQGGSLPVSYDSIRESFNFGGGSYTGVLEFRVAVAGEYQVDVMSDVGPVVVTKSLARLAQSNIGWLGLAGLGGVAGITGLVLLIVGTVRRSNAKKAPGGGWGPPQPGWGSYGGSPPAWGAPGGWPAPPPPGGWGGGPAPGGWGQPPPQPGGWVQPPPDPSGSPPPYT